MTIDYDHGHGYNDWNFTSSINMYGIEHGIKHGII